MKRRKFPPTRLIESESCKDEDWLENGFSKGIKSLSHEWVHVVAFGGKSSQVSAGRNQGALSSMGPQRADSYEPVTACFPLLELNFGLCRPVLLAVVRVSVDFSMCICRVSLRSLPF